VSLAEVTSGFKPVHLGHYEIHQCEVRHVKMKYLQRMVPTAGFANNDPLGALLQCRLESGSCRRTVVDYEDTDRLHVQMPEFSNSKIPFFIRMSLWRWKQYPQHLNLTCDTRSECEFVSSSYRRPNPPRGRLSFSFLLREPFTHLR
jgi:hypothetical protein